MRAFALFVVLGFVALESADADCVVRRRAVVQRQVVVQHAVHVAQAAVVAPVVAQFVPVAVPAYYAGYQPAAQVAQAEVEALRKEVAELRALLNHSPGLSPKRGEEKPKPAAEHPGLAVLKGKCASCHDAGVAKAKGNGLVLFEEEGQLSALSAEKLLAVTREVYQGRMPKGTGKLTDDEVGQIMDWIDKQR